MKKAIKIIFIVSIILSVLFLSLYFILLRQAADCDIVYEVKRHNALIVAANRFLYMFPPALVIAAGTGSALLVLSLKNNKIKAIENKLPDETYKNDNVRQIMAEQNLSYFEAVWQYFLSVGAVEKFKEAYLSQLRWHNIDKEIKEAYPTLTDKQKLIVRSELDKKIDGIKNGEYDRVFESVFQDEVKREIEMSNNNAVGGMSPNEYLTLLFDSSNGAVFFFDFAVSMENDMPIVRLDIDDGSIDWQPFD